MKRIAKRIAASMLAVMMVLSIVTSVSADIPRGKYYHFSTGATFMYEIAIINASSSDLMSYNDKELGARSELSRQMSIGNPGKGAVVREKDLNDGAGGHYIFMGWRTTDKPDEAITGIRLNRIDSSNDDAGENPVTSFTDNNGTTWTLANYGVSKNFENAAYFGKVDLNDEAGGDYIYMYYTKDPNYGPPLYSVGVLSSGDAFNPTLPSANNENYEAIRDFNNTWLNLNEEAGGDYIYLYAQSRATVCDVDGLRAYLPIAGKYVNYDKYVLPANYELNYNAAKRHADEWGDDMYYKGTMASTAINEDLSTLKNMVSFVKGKFYLDTERNGGPFLYARSMEFALDEDEKVVYDFSQIPASKEGWEYIGYSKDPDATSGETGNITVSPGETYYAIYRKAVTSEFYATSSNYRVSQSYLYGNNVYTDFAVPADFPESKTIQSREGETFTFAGWRKDLSAAAPEYPADTTGIRNVNNSSHHAVYRKSAEITFDTDGGSEVAAMSGTAYMNRNCQVAPTAFTLPAAPTKNGYTFQGWEAADNTVYLAGQQFTSSADTAALTAVWQPNGPVVPITANANDAAYGSVTGGGDYPTGANVTLTATENQGYEFVEWQENGAQVSTDLQYSFTVEGERSLTAVFAPIKYPITYQLNGGAFDGSYAEEYAYGTALTLPTDLLKEGHDFSGWYDNAGLIGTPITEIAAGEMDSKTFYAKWTVKTYPVRFDTLGYGDKPQDQTVEHGGKVVKPTDLITEHHEFDGWFVDSGCTDAWDFANDTVTANTTLYAKWVPKNYTVTWVDEDGTTELEKDDTVPYGTIPTFDSQTPTKPDHSFAGWSPAVTEVAGNTTYQATYVLLPQLAEPADLLWAEDIIGKVTWSSVEHASSYYVQLYHKSSGSAFEPVSSPITVHDNTYTFSITQEGEYYFTAQALGDGMNYRNGAMVRSEHKTFAAVTFEVQGHGATPADQLVAYGDKVVNPGELVATNYRFDGWYKESGCTDPWNFDTDTVSGNTTLYAKWTPIHQVSFETAFGTAPTAQSVAEGEKAAEPVAPTDTLNRFVGWYKEPSLTNVWDFAVDTVASDTVLYAKWEPIPCDVTIPTVDGAIIRPVGGDDTVNKGDSFSFTVEVENGYDDSNIIVKANGEPLTPDPNGVYTIPGVMEDIIITVEGVVYVVPPIMLRLENFATTTGAFLDEAYYAREARAGDIVTLKISTTELGDKYGLDYKKLTVKYEVEGAVQLGSSYDYHGNPIYKDGIATDFMLSEGFNKMVAHVYYAGSYVGKFEPFYILI